MLTHPKPAWSARGKSDIGCSYPICSSHILLLLVILLTEFLHAPSTRCRAPMDLSHVWGLGYGRKGRICWCRWQSNKYNVGASNKFDLFIPPFCCVHICKVIWGNFVKTYFIAVCFQQLVRNKGLTQSLVTGLYVHHTHQTRAGLSL